uniref:hemolysin E n=1 Tax=Escherichia coli TaxID=562 RepID=UPI001FCCE018
MTEIVADKTVEVVKNAIETADGALDLYNKYLDQVIPWQTFDETIKELSRFKQEYSQAALMNPLMILVKIIKLRWIHILSYDQMVSRKINNQTTRCANSIFYTTL